MFQEKLCDNIQFPHSNIIENKMASSHHAAVLILQGNKTYGKLKNKYYYRCVPNSKNVKEGLLLYNINNLSWNKFQKNKYIIIEETDVIIQGHPLYKMTETIGDVDVLENFYIYNAYCKDVYFNDFKAFNTIAKKFKNLQQQQQIIDNLTMKCKEDRTHHDSIISIDPIGSIDIDDAFGIHINDNGQLVLSIYIANVPMYIDEMNAFSVLSRQVSTIYFPNGKRPMIPAVLSDNLCSLIEGKDRFALVCDITLEKSVLKTMEKTNIVSVSFTNCKMRVAKNYSYDDVEHLKQDQTYTMTKRIVEVLNSHENSYFEQDTEFDSHSVISYLMVFMNHQAAQLLAKEKRGIFRSITEVAKKTKTKEKVPNEIKQFVRGWNSDGGGKYTTQPLTHDLLNLNVYTHVTSPIRRIVDLVNSIEIQHALGLFSFSETEEGNEGGNEGGNEEGGNEEVGNEEGGCEQEKRAAIKFCKDCKKDVFIDEVNRQMKSIRKVQTECNLLHLFSGGVGVIDKSYIGYICEKNVNNDKTKYVVYLHELNLISTYNSKEDLEMYGKYMFQLYHFKDKSSFKEKIKLCLKNK